MKETRVFFLRHGVTDWNNEGRWQGQTDISLNTTGLEQAEAAAERLKGLKFDHIYASDLSRAFATAEAVAQAQGNANLHSAPAWRERHAGDFEGMTSPDIAERFPDAYAQMMKGILEPPNGESFVDFTQRISKELDRITTEHEGEDILVVSHGGTIRGMCNVTLGAAQDQVWKFQVGNTSLSLMIHGDRGWKLEFWNDLRHLNADNLSSRQECLTL